jgi:hypothetical protein
MRESQENSMITEALPDSAVKKAKNLVRDARLATLVGLIPILGLIFVLRLVQWHLLKQEYPVLVTTDASRHAELAKDFRWALPRLYFAVFFWPALVAFPFIYLRVT